VDFSADLDPEQLAVVTAPPGPALVIAGAGSGKTRALTYRVAYLVARGTPPERILLATFTNRASREMLRRVAELTSLPPAAMRTLWAGTFHHIANLAIQRYGRVLGLPERYVILDREDARELLAVCIADEGKEKLTERRYPQPPVLQSLISLAANVQDSLENAILAHQPRWAEAAPFVTRIAERYARKKAELAACDFDDLLLFWKLAMLDHPSCAEELRERFRYVLVDEYQDTNKLQCELIDLVAAGHRNVMVVGDDAQSIYSFRGADVTGMLAFGDRYPDARTYKLETNYRSTPGIVGLANRSISHNRMQHPKSLRAVRDGGTCPAWVPMYDVYQQATFVAQRALELSQTQGVPLGEIAVLYRNHGHSLELQVEFVRRKIPYVVRSGLRFFEQAHVKDVVSYLRVVHNGRDELAWSRLLRLYRGVGEASRKRVIDAVKQAGSHEVLADPALARTLPSAARTPLAQLGTLLCELSADPADPARLIQRVLAGHYGDYARAAFENADVRLADLEQLAEFARRQGDLAAFLAELALAQGVTAEGAQAGDLPDECITLSTVHQAKGLEWSAVFVLWLSEGRFPQATALKTCASEEEERRLFYVACTRARDELYLCTPRMGEAQDGGMLVLRPSRFVGELASAAPPFETWELAESAT
jgi:DNA helicase-2/ATP-dependent DNA helicase PcrA